MTSLPLLVLSLVLSSAVSLRACQICLPYPTTSLADHLIDADHAVLARENPERPFSLVATDIIKGEGAFPDIDLFLDSQSRRVLAGDESKHIVCAYRNTGEPRGWKRVALGNATLRSLMVDILATSPAWVANPSERPTYFAPLLDNKDSQIATLAHLEVAGAPYSEIRSLAHGVPIKKLRSFLDNIRYAEWHALYILLLAQSDDPDDHHRIIRAAHSNADHSITLQTAAWATAYIEIKELEAIAFFDQHYLTSTDRNLEEIKSILAALSVHGTNGHIHLRDRIVESYGNLADKYPQLLPSIAEDLKKWQRWDLTETVSEALVSDPGAFDLESTLQLRSYLREAAGDREPTSKPKAAKHFAIWIAVALLMAPVMIKLLGAGRNRAGAPP